MVLQAAAVERRRARREEGSVLGLWVWQASVVGSNRANMTCCSRVPVLVWHGRNDYSCVRADIAAVLRAAAREAVGRSFGEMAVGLAVLSSRALEDSRRAGWVGAEGHFLLRAEEDAAIADMTEAEAAAPETAARVVELAGDIDAAALAAHAMLGEQAAGIEVEAVCDRGDRVSEGRTPYDMGPFSQGLISHELREQYERKGAVRQHRPSGRVPTLLPV